MLWGAVTEYVTRTNLFSATHRKGVQRSIKDALGDSTLVHFFRETRRISRHGALAALPVIGEARDEARNEQHETLLGKQEEGVRSSQSHYRGKGVGLLVSLPW